MANICRYYQTGFCKYKSNCNLKHINQDCVDNLCDKKSCEKRHRRNCIYFEKHGKCVFGTFCKFKHVKLEYLRRIETLEEKVQKYDKEYDQF